MLLRRRRRGGVSGMPRRRNGRCCPRGMLLQLMQLFLGLRLLILSLPRRAFPLARAAGGALGGGGGKFVPKRGRPPSAPPRRRRRRWVICRCLIGIAISMNGCLLSHCNLLCLKYLLVLNCGFASPLMDDPPLAPRWSSSLAWE